MIKAHIATENQIYKGHGRYWKYDGRRKWMLAGHTSTIPPSNLHCNRPSTSQPLRASAIFTTTPRQPNSSYTNTESANLPDYNNVIMHNQRKICSQQNNWHIRPHAWKWPAWTLLQLPKPGSLTKTDLPVTRALTPPGYNLIHHRRSSRRGGNCNITQGICQSNVFENIQ